MPQLYFEALYTFLLVVSCFYESLERKSVFTPGKDRENVYVVCVFVSLTAERGYENSHSSRHRSIAGDLAVSRPGAAVKRQAEIYSALWDITQSRGHLATSSQLTCYCVLAAKPEHPLNPPDLTHPKSTGPHSEGLSFWFINRINPIRPD